MPFGSSMANALRITGEALVLRQRGAASTNSTTQVTTYAASTETNTYGQLKSVDSGSVDGVSVLASDLDAYLPILQLEGAGVTPAVGDFLIRGDGTVLVLLGLETQTKAGFYRVRARS